MEKSTPPIESQTAAETLVARARACNAGRSVVTLEYADGTVAKVVVTIKKPKRMKP